MGIPRLRCEGIITAYDRAYRRWHALDRPAAEVPPALRVEIRRSYRTVRLTEAVIGYGDRVGVLHLDNLRVATLHEHRESPMAVGLQFRRLLVASLEALADRTRPAGELAALPAFMAVTIFHHGLKRLGFEAEPRGLFWPRCTAVYQRALLASLHPDGVFRLQRVAFTRAERLWISGDRLRALYGEGSRVRGTTPGSPATPRDGAARAIMAASGSRWPRAPR